MLVPNQLIEIYINNKNRDHFQNIGYDVKFGDTIVVPPNHLPNNSHSIVKVICDVCKTIIDKPYRKYVLQHNYDMDCCKKCSLIKYRMTMMDKYGVDNAFKSNEIKNKIKQTTLLKYGYEHITQVPEIIKKRQQTFKQNGTTKTSKQQIMLYEIIKTKYKNAEINYPLSACSLDIFICVDNIKIDVEYDGSYWHQDKQKDIKRDKFLQSQGFKIFRIRSSRLLPSEQEIFDVIDELITTDRCFKAITLSDWKEEVDLCQEQLQVAM